MKKLLLNLYFWPAFVIVTVFGLSILPIILLINVVFLKRDISKALRLAIRFYGWVLVCLVPFMAPVRVVGKAGNIPRPSILVSNHNSAIDPFLFGAIPLENCFLTSWPFKIPVYGPFMKLAGYINTVEGWENIRQQCINRLDSGVFITIWPEGHRSRDGQLGRFHKGAFQLAVETGYPIQPVCILGSADIMFPGERILSPGRVKLVLLEPLLPDKNSDPQSSISMLRQKAVQAIDKCLKENRKSDVPTQSFNSCSDDIHMTSGTCRQHPHDVH